MVDWILATVALLALAAFMGVVVSFVAEPDLAVVAGLGLLLAAYDFWRTLRGPRNGSRRSP